MPNCFCSSSNTLTTNYKTDLGSIFVSYADVQSLLCDSMSIATLILTNTQTSVASNINFYSTQIGTGPNTYYIQENTIVTLIVRSGYYLDLNTSVTTDPSGGLPSPNVTDYTLYYPGNYTLMDTNNNVSGTVITGSININSINIFNTVGQYWSLLPTVDLNPTSVSYPTSGYFVSVIGNLFNNQAIIIGNNGSQSYSSGTTVITNLYISTSSNITDVSFNQISLTGVNFTIQTSNYPVAINNNSTCILFPVLGNTTTELLPIIGTLNGTDTIPATTPFGNFSLVSGQSVPTFCQIQYSSYYNKYYCMIAASNYLYINLGSLTFQQAVYETGTTISFSSINTISMSENGQYLLVGNSSSFYNYSNNYGLSFSAGVIILPYIQISAKSKYAVGANSSSTTPLLYISNDYGTTFTAVASSAFSPALSTVSSTLEFNSVSISDYGEFINVCLVNINDNYKGYVYYSTDYGASFTLSTSNVGYYPTNIITHSSSPIGIISSNTAPGLGSLTNGIFGIYISQ